MSDGSPVRRVTRSATAPIRGYLNDHFEMVKQEIRDSADQTGSDELAWQRLAELENVLAEQSQHLARVLARLGDETAALTERIADLERVVRQLATVVAPADES
jgi:transposase